MSTEKSSHQSVTLRSNTNTDATDTDTCDRDIKVEPDDDMITDAKIN